MLRLASIIQSHALRATADSNTCMASGWQARPRLSRCSCKCWLQKTCGVRLAGIIQAEAQQMLAGFSRETQSGGACPQVGMLVKCLCKGGRPHSTCPSAASCPSPDFEVHKHRLMTRICLTEVHELARAPVARQDDIGKGAAAEQAGRVGCILQQWPQQAVWSMAIEPSQIGSMHPSHLS